MKYPRYEIWEKDGNYIISVLSKDRAIRIATRKHESTKRSYNVYFVQSNFNDRLVYEVPSWKNREIIECH